MSPGSLEAAGLISQSEYLKVAALTQSTSSEAHKKIAGWSFIIFYCLVGSPESFSKLFRNYS